ncbi:hypothetical protein D3C76_1608640 [compost metagenome]
MYIAFIEHSQHQVHRQQRAKDHPRLALLGGGEGIGSAGHLGNHFFRQAEPGDRPFDRGTALLHRHPFGHVERHAFRGELPFMADAVVFQAVFVVGNG